MSGYTHIIYFDKYLKNLEVTAKDQYFRTTEDAVHIHVRGLLENQTVSNIRVEAIPTQTEELT